MEKKEILANMYALRAGLSVVAANSDKVDKKLKRAKDKAKQDEKTARKALKDAQSDLQKEQAAVDEAKKELEERKQAGKSQIKAAGENINGLANHFLSATLKSVFLLIGVAACVYLAMVWPLMRGYLGEPPSSQFLVTLYGWALGKVWSQDVSLAGSFLVVVIEWVMFFVMILAVAGAGFLLYLIVASYCGFSLRRGKSTKGMKSASKIKKEIADLEEDITYINMLISACESGIDKTVAEGKANIAKVCADVAPTCESTLALYSALKNTFGTFIDERDWDNLDLLTYYIETGRADTVKESLQLLDRQKQTDQIVAAVNEAAGAICRTVSTGLAALQNDMRKCFNILSDQITTVGRMVDAVAGGIDAMGSRISSVESVVASQSAQIADMVSAESLNHALLARANDTSAELVGYYKTCAANSKYATDVIRQAQIGGRL